MVAQASFTGHLEVVNYLLSAGADDNHLNASGMSPLYAAAQGGKAFGEEGGQG